MQLLSTRGKWRRKAGKGMWRDRETGLSLSLPLSLPYTCWRFLTMGGIHFYTLSHHNPEAGPGTHHSDHGPYSTNWIQSPPWWVRGLGFPHSSDVHHEPLSFYPAPPLPPHSTHEESISFCPSHRPAPPCPLQVLAPLRLHHGCISPQYAKQVRPQH